MLYSRRFFADRASLLSVDLGIEEKYKPVIEKHIKFFANKERTQRFYDLEIENFNEENILVGLLSAVCKARTCSFEEVVRIVLTEKVNFAEGERETGLGRGELVDNAFLQEFEKYDLLSAFWQLCEQHFGYTDTKPSLERLLVTLFVTYTGRYVQAELPAAWKSFVSYKSGNIIAFLDSLMNSVLYLSLIHICDSNSIKIRKYSAKTIYKNEYEKAVLTLSLIHIYSLDIYDLLYL